MLYNFIQQYLGNGVTRKDSQEYLKRFGFNRERTFLWEQVIETVLNQTDILVKSNEIVVLRQSPIFKNHIGIVPSFNLQFMEELEFISLQRLMRKNSEMSFLLIDISQIESSFKLSDSNFVFEYPTSCSFKEIFEFGTDSETYSSGLVFEINRPIRNWIMIGSSGKWAKYIGNDDFMNKGVSYYGVFQHDDYEFLVNDLVYTEADLTMLEELYPSNNSYGLDKFLTLKRASQSNL